MRVGWLHAVLDSMFLSEVFHEVCAYILASVEPATGSEENTVARLGLPEFPKDGDEGVPTTSTKPKRPVAGTHTLAVRPAIHCCLSICSERGFAPSGRDSKGGLCGYGGVALR